MAPDDHRAFSVREAMNRVGLLLFPDQWTGKEYLDHWKLGLNPWPTTKLRGMEAVRELLSLVWDGAITVEVETSDGVYEPLAAEDVRYFHGGESLVGDVYEFYCPCRLIFHPVMYAHATSRGGRKGYNWAPIVVRILEYLDEHGTTQSADQITNSIIAAMGKDPKPPHYSKVQPYVSALLAYRCTVTQKFPELNSGTNGCDPDPVCR